MNMSDITGGLSDDLNNGVGSNDSMKRALVAFARDYVGNIPNVGVGAAFYGEGDKTAAVIMFLDLTGNLATDGAALSILTRKLQDDDRVLTYSIGHAARNEPNDKSAGAFIPVELLCDPHRAA